MLITYPRSRFLSASPTRLQLGALEAEDVKETTRTIRGRVREELARRVDLDDAALVHETMRSAIARAKPISWVTMSIVMPVRASSEDDVEDLAHHLRVEGGGDLVEEEDLGVHHEGAHDGDALALAAGELNVRHYFTPASRLKVLTRSSTEEEESRPSTTLSFTAKVGVPFTPIFTACS